MARIDRFQRYPLLLAWTDKCGRVISVGCKDATAAKVIFEELTNPECPQYCPPERVWMFKKLGRATTLFNQTMPLRIEEEERETPPTPQLFDN